MPSGSPDSLSYSVWTFDSPLNLLSFHLTTQYELFMGSLFTYNIYDGGLEAETRGLKQALLSAADWMAVAQCENLEDLKLHLSTTSCEYAHRHIRERRLFPAHSSAAKSAPPLLRTPPFADAAAWHYRRRLPRVRAVAAFAGDRGGQGDAGDGARVRAPAQERHGAACGCVFWSLSATAGH